MRKEIAELTDRCEKAEKAAAEARADADRQIELARRDYENRIEELRMQGAAKDLQIRMKKIEEQLRLLQKLTSVDIDLPDMPTEEEIEQVAEREALEREEKAAAEENKEVTE